MCTTLCPCSATVVPAEWSESRLNTYYRTNKVYNANYTNATTGITYEGFVLRSDTFQPNFYSCYMNELAPLNATTFTLDQTVVNIFQQIETGFMCNGICDYGNFYFFINVDQGPPT